MLTLSHPLASLLAFLIFQGEACGRYAKGSLDHGQLMLLEYSVQHEGRILEEDNINDYTTNSYDISAYVNPNDTYVPSSEVEQGTDISAGDFSMSRDYYIDGAATPIILFCVGLLSLFVFNISLCCGITKVCTRKSGNGDNEDNLSCGEYCTSLVFSFFIIFCFCAAHVLYAGYSDITEGLDVMRTSTNTIGIGFGDMSTHAESLKSHSETLLPMCTAYGSCHDQANTLDTGVEYMVDDLGDIPERVHDINTDIDLVEATINVLTFVTYAVLIVTLLVYVLTQLCCKSSQGHAICCGNLAFILVSFIGILWMIITSVTADYCYKNPTVNTINALKASKGQMYLVWYSSCYSGENPVLRYANYTTRANEAVVDSLNNDTSTAANDIREQTELIAHLLGDFKQATDASCSHVQLGWLPLVNEGVCEDFYLGVRTVWMCEVAACISLFFIMVTGAMMGRAAKDRDHAVHPSRSQGRERHYLEEQRGGREEEATQTLRNERGEDDSAQTAGEKSTTSFQFQLT